MAVGVIVVDLVAVVVGVAAGCAGVVHDVDVSVLCVLLLLLLLSLFNQDTTSNNKHQQWQTQQQH